MQQTAVYASSERVGVSFSIKNSCEALKAMLRTL
jgi:hypothetical protein